MAGTRLFSLLVLATLLLSAAIAPLQAADARTSVPVPLSQSLAQSLAPDACVPLQDVTEWIADFTFSWHDAAEGELFNLPGRASVNRQASTSQRLTRFSDMEASDRWYAVREEAEVSGLIGVDDRAASNDGTVTYSTTGNGAPNDDNFNMAYLEVYPDCTYSIKVGFDGDVINHVGTTFEGTLLLGNVYMRGLPLPTALFDVTLAGSASVPYNNSANTLSTSAFFVGFDAGLNELISMRGGGSPPLADAHFSWRLVPANHLPCAQRTSAIDAADPNLEDLHLTIDVDPPKIAPNQGNSLQPPDPAKLTIRATCGLAPVKNAQIKVAVEAKTRSGGHVHENGERPRGFLNKNATGTYTEITKANPTITVQTDATGRAVLYFRPGVDLAAGGAQACSGKQRGISGLYEVTATPTAPRFAANEAKQAITVERTDFAPIVAGPLIQLISSSRHPQGISGTATTVAALNALAAAFNSAQLDNNTARLQAALPPWRIVTLPLVDASLQAGGLYETQGIDVCQSGQPLVPFRDWQIPHQTHMFGTAVDIKTSLWSLPSDPENARQFAWWRNTLRALGCNYGTWARERVSFHLDVAQDAASHGSFHSNCQYTPDASPQELLTGASAPLYTPQANMPDLFVTLLPDAPEEEVRLAPGQRVTYSVGLSNLFGDVIAHTARLTATLPAGLTFVGSDPPGTQAGNLMSWTAGDLAPHALPQLFFFAVQVAPATAVNTTFEVTIETTSSDVESTLENNSDFSSLLVAPLGPDLTVDSTLDVVAMTVDRPFTATLEASNQGNTVAPNSTLRLEIPAGTTLVSTSLTPTLSSGTFVEWGLGSVLTDSTRLVTVTLALDASLIEQFPVSAQVGNPLVSFTTRVATSGTDNNTSNNSATFQQEATFSGHDLQLWLQVAGSDGGAIDSGQTLTYTLLYGNFGSEPALSPTISLTMGAGLTLLTTDPPASGSGPYQWTTPTLAVGEVRALHARVRVDSIPAAGSQVNASAFALNGDSNLLNNRAADLRSAEQAGGATFLPTIDKE